MARIHAIESLHGFTGQAGFGRKIDVISGDVSDSVGSEGSLQIDEEVERMGRNVIVFEEEDTGDNDESHELTDNITKYVENLVDVEVPRENVNRHGVPTRMITSWRI